MFWATLSEYEVDQNIQPLSVLGGGVVDVVQGKAFTTVKMMSSDDPNAVIDTFSTSNGKFQKLVVVMSQEEYMKLKVLAAILSE